MEHHYTHNISGSSSELQYEKHINNGNSSHSSDKNIIDKNKSQNEWSKILLIDNSKRVKNEIINEDEIVISACGKNENENKGNLKLNKKGVKNNKLYHYKYIGKNCIMLSNGIIVKNMNKLKKKEKPKMKINEYNISKDLKNANNNDLKSINQGNIPNNNNNIEGNTNSHLEFLLKQKEEKAKCASFQMIYIKRPNRSFITKICKYKNQKFKPSKEFKRLNSSLGIYNKQKPNSSRISSVRTALSKPSKCKSKSKSKSKIKDINHKLKQISNENWDTKLGSVSTTTCNKKNSLASNASAFFNKSNNILSNNLLSNNLLNNNVISNNKNRKRPLSSFNVVRNDGNINIRSSKFDNFDNNTTYNKSYNLQKTLIMDSKEYQAEINNIMYNNENFMNQFKELKNAFELYGERINWSGLKIFEDKKHQTYRQNSGHMLIEDDAEEKKTIRKINSSKFKNSSYHNFYPRELSPLFDYRNRNNYEDEKQNKQSNCCIKCGYKKHFGNEKNCPVCITIKEQNQLKEENLNNKKYYFPLKFKFDKNNYAQKTFRNYENNFKELYNTNNENEKVKSHYLNYMFSSPNSNIIPNINNNNQELRKNRSNFLDDYCAVQKYFE